MSIDVTRDKYSCAYSRMGEKPGEGDSAECSLENLRYQAYGTAIALEGS